MNNSLKGKQAENREYSRRGLVFISVEAEHQKRPLFWGQRNLTGSSAKTGTRVEDRAEALLWHSGRPVGLQELGSNQDDGRWKRKQTVLSCEAGQSCPRHGGLSHLNQTRFYFITSDHLPMDNCTPVNYYLEENCFHHHTWQRLACMCTSIAGMMMMTSQEEKYREDDRFLAKDRKNFKLLGDKSKDTEVCAVAAYSRTRLPQAATLIKLTFLIATVEAP